MAERPIRPVERFLGAEAASGGPFALLGIPAAPCPGEQIILALERRLAQVGSHVLAETPEADELRLALHAAAAQLLDPRVRRQMLKSWASDGSERDEAAVQFYPLNDAVAIEHDAILTLGMFGGWNRKSLRRIAMIAHARGIPSHRVGPALRALVGRRSRVHRVPGGIAAGAAPEAGGQAAEPTEPVARRPNLPASTTYEPAQRTLRAALAVGGLGLLALVAGLVATVAWMSRGSGGPGAGGGSSTSGATTSGAEVASATSDSPRAPELFPSIPPVVQAPEPAAPDPSTDASGGMARDEIVRELRAAIAGLGQDPRAALERFEGAIGAIERRWGEMPADQRLAAHGEIVEFLYRAATWPEILTRGVAAICGGSKVLSGGERPLRAERVWPAAWSVGMLTRLGQERNLPVSAHTMIEGAIAGAMPGGRAERATFEAGASSGLVALARVLTPIPDEGDPGPAIERWQKWLSAIDSLGLASADRDAIVLAGLDALLLDGPEPDQSRASYEAIGLVVASLGWREGDAPRAWLVEAFDAPGITAPDLYAVTSALATRSRAPGVDLTMVLPVKAGPIERRDARDRFAQAWGIVPGAGTDALASDWAERTRRAIDGSRSHSSMVESLAAAVGLARLNAAAAWRWQGEPDAAGRLVDSATTAAEVLSEAGIGTDGRVPSRRSAPTDDEWALRYLNAQSNIPVRLDLLSQLSRAGGALGPVSAELLVSEAVRGSPEQVRSAALEIVIRRAGDPAVVNALLEVLPRMPRTISNSRLVGDMTGVSLPGVGSDRWRVAARSALVERLLELEAGEGEFAAVDRLSEELSSAYAEQGLGSPPGTGGGAQVGPAEESIIAVRARWQAQAERAIAGRSGPMTLGEAMRRRASRMQLADGPARVFAVEQLAVCELMAVVVVSEQPLRAGQVARTLDALDEDRRRASNLMEQLAATERAIARLWLIRAGESAW